MLTFPAKPGTGQGGGKYGRNKARKEYNEKRVKVLYR